MAKKARNIKEIAKNEDAPEFFKGCKFWKLMQCQKTEASFPLACGKCDGCRLNKHEGLVSRGLAEAQSAACTLFVTLTYEDDEKGEYLDYSDVEKFLMRLRKDTKLRKLSAGEYGTKAGRAHWHVLLYFQWSEEHLEQWKKEQIEINRRGEYTGESWSAKRAKDWPKYAPDLRMGRIRSKPAFMDALANPESLWVDTMGLKNAGEYPQKWKYWQHGNVEARIVSAPNIGTEQEQNKAVRYAVKYASKDPWKDGKLRNTPFEELPEWIKQATAFGPWDENGTNERTKWVRGNSYVKNLEQRLLTEFPSDEDVPPDRQIKKHRYNYKAQGGLGRDYFECLGAWYAKNAGSQEELITRVFKLGPSYKKPRDKYFRDGYKWHHLEKAVRQSQRVDLVPKLNRFYMGDTAFRQFAKGFNAYLTKIGKSETTGPEHIFDVLDTKSKRASDVSSGQMGLLLWEKDTGSASLNKQHRQTLEKIWGELPAEKLAGLVPQRLQRMLETNSQLEGWKIKREQRAFNDRYGRPKYTHDFGKYKIIETANRHFFLEKYATDKGETVRWYSTEVQTLEELQTALTGNIPRRFTTGKKRTLLTSFDIRTVRKRIAKAQQKESRC